ncbi:TetR/AcrR family transcriptional regulator [Rhizorhabdus dicambivorans]|uniref:TetR/AcrR family transcriptional regulator n=1 Tax=Rhizorhabdus dicambivorans TaxID=1850238 RepID=A0A2A4FQY0_9SPHN|nr:TetR/AcrR family transcriptional regulator [Rhizorhabdus dicambivorans]ATE65752.1 TetR/AcrR family transcriptional regulator [Rhizorhabdus dicambivorans]PCE41165.1 TetR/AcrR family transcriptional regulator [Rhizorhabdus dicambivorans]
MRYEKGRKDASRRRIMEVATDRFRNDGIAASGLAAIMSDAGLTNGAFYPHFPSKADLVQACVVTALDEQWTQLREIIAAGGPAAAIAIYLSPEHRDNPGKGCALAALLPELARQPAEAHNLYAERLLALVREMAATLSPEIKDREGVALSIQAILIGALQLSRAVSGTPLSDRILTIGTDAVRTLITHSVHMTPAEAGPPDNHKKDSV